jgi:hypothetical protein
MSLSSELESLLFLYFSHRNKRLGLTEFFVVSALCIEPFQDFLASRCQSLDVFFAGELFARENSFECTATSCFSVRLVEILNISVFQAVQAELTLNFAAIIVAFVGQAFLKVDGDITWG